MARQASKRNRQGRKKSAPLVKSRRSEKLCKATARPKVRFDNQDAAEAEIAFRAALHGSKRKVATRAYRCESCHGWHITSQRKHTD